MAGRPKRNADIAALDLTDKGEQAIKMLADGKFIGHICYSLGVGKHALLQWMEGKSINGVVDAERAARVQRAREYGASHLVEEAKQIADGELPVVIEGQPLYDVSRDKLRMNVRQWIAERVDRAAWGQQQQELTVNINGLHLSALRAAPAQVVEMEALQVVDNSQQQGSGSC